MLDYSASIPPDAITLADYERHAQRLLSPNAWAYLAGGAGHETTLRANRESYDRFTLEPRVLRDFSIAHTQCDLLGTTLPHPILLAPVAYHHLFHPHGEAATVAGAGAMDTTTIISSQASTSLEDIASAASSPLWWQLYFQPERSQTLELIARVEAAGYRAIVLTVDAPVSGIRDREARARFQLPSGVSAVNLAQPPARTHAELDHQGHTLLLETISPPPTWEDVAWLIAHTKLPVWLKGILNSDDALQAVTCGAAGVIVSNHGGRTLDTAPTTLRALPRVADKLEGRVPILLDGGIRRGTDVLKALSLGAQAVLIGRPYVHGLAVAGALGVAHVIKLLRMELEVAMLLAGCPTLAHAPSLRLYPTD